MTCVRAHPLYSNRSMRKTAVPLPLTFQCCFCSGSRPSKQCASQDGRAFPIRQEDRGSWATDYRSWIESEVKEVEKEIQSVARRLEKASEDPAGAGTIAYLRDKEKQLRKKEEQLRDEKWQLRNKEEQLRNDKLLLQDSGLGEILNIAHCPVRNISSMNWPMFCFRCRELCAPPLPRLHCVSAFLMYPYLGLGAYAARVWKDHNRSTWVQLKKHWCRLQWTTSLFLNMTNERRKRRRIIKILLLQRFFEHRKFKRLIGVSRPRTTRMTTLITANILPYGTDRRFSVNRLSRSW